MARAATLLASVLALVPLLVGCGADRTAADLGEAAALAPADARAFLAVRTDGEAEQTQRALELLARFPAVAEHELDLEREVLPVLGDETALVVLAGGEQVVLTQPQDRERFEQLIERLRERTVTRELDGWTALAREEATLDALERAQEQGSLAEGEGFREAFDELPEAVAKLWTSDRGEGHLSGTVAAVRAEEDGFLLDGHRTASEEVEAYRPALLGRVPAGAVAVASFHGREGLEDRLRLLPFLSVLDLPQLGGALEGEGVLVLRPAALVPELTLLAEVEDEEAAERAAGALLGRIGRQEPGGPAAGGSRVQVGPLTVTYGARDGVLALTSSPQGLGVLDPAAAPLGEDPHFERVRERAGVAEETTGFLYVRGDELAPMLALVGLLGGEPVAPELRANLERLGSGLLHGGRDGDRHTLRGFFEVVQD